MSFGWRLHHGLRVEFGHAAGLLVRVLSTSLLLFRLALNLAELLGVVSVEALVMEVALGVVLAYFVEVVHVELGGGRGTCRTNEE